MSTALVIVNRQTETVYKATMRGLPLVLWLCSTVGWRTVKLKRVLIVHCVNDV